MNLGTSNAESVSLIPIGGVGDVTRNMYVYEYKDQMLIVDCGLGFPDESMLGVDLLLPDISYILESKKKIVGMLFTHGHEDHIGGLPFILPQFIEKGLATFPMMATPLTAALANEKLKEFAIGNRVQAVEFTDAEKQLGDFKISFTRVTHSVPDTSHIFIKTPVGNFYHGSDFKFDLTPADKKPTDFKKIASLTQSGVLCLLSDCLGAERPGSTPSELDISDNFEKELRNCKGKFIVTTYSSNISRLNQAIDIASKYGRKVCFIGRSLIKAKEVAEKIGYMKIPPGMEIEMDEVKKHKGDQLLLIVAGSQGQENSAMSRISLDDHREVWLTPEDVVVFSSDPIPGNELSVNALIDSIAKKGVRVVYSQMTDKFHVSGHGYSHDLMLLMEIAKPSHMVPIGGTYKHMVAYKRLAQKLGFGPDTVHLIENGQELIFYKDKTCKKGRKIQVRHVYVDEITGDEIDSFVLRDRQKLSEAGFIVIMAEIDANTGQPVRKPEIISRGFTAIEDMKVQSKIISQINTLLATRKGQVSNWVHLRKMIQEATERVIFKEFRVRPLVLPVVIEL